MPKTLKRKPIVMSEGFKFDPVAHVYTLNGKPLHGVTSVLRVIAKPALINWSAGVACDYIEESVRQIATNNEGIEWMKEFGERWGGILREARVAHTKKKEEAGASGTDVHAVIENTIKAWIQYNAGFPTPAESNNAQVNQFIIWATSNNVKFLESEKQMYSEKLWCAGTADFICEIEGKLYVGDVKTSSSIYPEYFIQCSAYAHMAREMGLYKDFHGVVIVNVPKKGGLKVKENYDLKGNFKAFQAALTLHKFQLSQTIKK